MNLDFYKNKRVLITGHTGFKGSWLTEMLISSGVVICGYSLDAPTNPSLFKLIDIENRIEKHVIGDIRDLEHLKKVFDSFQPEIVFHLAAQPIVRESYKNPVLTYETNVLGTVNLMECVRLSKSVKSVINVTTDKVYRNNEWERGYVENDFLNGFDPYSNSKSCSELVTSSYINSFLNNDDSPSVSTLRAGNVIGGGDFAVDRIIPDCVRAGLSNNQMVIRNPNSVRPYQHVLEPLMVYLMIAEKQFKEKKYAGSYNVGPDDRDCLTTGELVRIFSDEWLKKTGKKVDICCQSDGGPHEANFLKLDCSLLKNTFGWQPKFTASKAIEMVVEWTCAYSNGEDILKVMHKQIDSCNIT